MPIRALHILSGDLWGGREAQVELQVGALRAAGIDAQTLVFNEGMPANRFRKAKIPVWHFDESRGLFRLAWNMHRHLKTNRPDILVTHGYKETVLGGLLALRHKIPFIPTFHGAVEHYSGIAFLKMKFYQRIERWLALNKATNVICVSHALARQLGFDGSPKLAIILNVVKSYISPSISEANSGRHTKRLISVGRLVKVKRLDLLLRTIKEFPPGAVQLQIVGEGPEHQDLVRLSSDLAVNRQVEFLGFRQDALMLIAQSDALLLTSDSEGIPTVLLETLCCGIPLISRDLPGIREVLDLFPNYPARLVPESDPKAFADAIRNLLSNSTRAGNTFQPVLTKHFSPEGAAKKHIELYEAIARAKASVPANATK